MFPVCQQFFYFFDKRFFAWLQPGQAGTKKAILATEGTEDTEFKKQRGPVPDFLTFFTSVVQN
jgi:hypothetical protein